MEQRLKFASSLEIAPAVRTISLNGVQRSKDLQVADEALLMSLRAASSSLFNLRNFEIRDMCITEDVLAIILNTPRLQCISITDCDVRCDAGSTARPSSLKAVRFTYRETFRPLPPRVRDLVTFLTAGSIQEVSLTSRGNQQLGEFVRTTASIPSLQRLTLNRNALYNEGFLMAVCGGKYGTLTSLTLSPVDAMVMPAFQTPPSLQPSFLPKLTHVEAELADISAFSGLRLSQLTIHCAGDLKYAHQFGYIHKAATSNAPSIKVLVSGKVSEAFLFALLASLTHARHLEISCSRLRPHDRAEDLDPDLEEAYPDLTVSSTHAHS